MILIIIKSETKIANLLSFNKKTMINWPYYQNKKTHLKSRLPKNLIKTLNLILLIY